MIWLHSGSNRYQDRGYGRWHRRPLIGYARLRMAGTAIHLSNNANHRLLTVRSHMGRYSRIDSIDSQSRQGRRRRGPIQENTRKIEPSRDLNRNRQICVRWLKKMKLSSDSCQIEMIKNRGNTKVMNEIVKGWTEVIFGAGEQSETIKESAGALKRL